MNELEIQRHSFDVAKNRLKEFSEKTEAELEIDKVKTDGGFLGLGDHKVTGYELNGRLETIQGHFIAVNTINNKVIKEFREIYNALDALDKDYIASIVANVKAIEKTSDDVRKQQGSLKQHNEKLEKQQGKLDAHQVEIEKTVANISKIITALKGFKEELEGYIHLQDIDDLWEDLDVLKTSIQNINEDIKGNREDIQMHQNKLNLLDTARIENKTSIDTLFKKLATIEEYATNNRNIINELETFRIKVSALNHLMEIDEIWKQAERYQLSIESVEQERKSCTDKLNELVQANDIIHEHMNLNVRDINSLKEHKEEIDEKIANAIQVTNTVVETLTKKIKYAYWIAGGSAGLAIVELALLLMKVM